jgi:glutamine cyclotransferase
MQKRVSPPCNWNDQTYDYGTNLRKLNLHFILALTLLAGCDKRTETSAAPPTQPAGSSQTPRYSYEVVHTYPHDPKAFTQGLVFLDGALLESTGNYGRSTLRKVELETGKVLKQVEVPSQYFAEGIAVLTGKIFQLTWQEQKGFVYDLQNFQLEMEFTYPGEGWGLTTDGHFLIQSDGTDKLRFVDPATFAIKRTLSVSDHGIPINRLNELEYIKGEIFANVWQSNEIVRVEPATGKVLGIIDFTGLLPVRPGERVDVLNGIAYDEKTDRLFVTGKWWPKLFEVRLKLK